MTAYENINICTKLNVKMYEHLAQTIEKVHKSKNNNVKRLDQLSKLAKLAIEFMDNNPQYK